MTVFDLLFIVLALSAVIAVIAAIAHAVRGRGMWALRTLRNLVICAAGYVGVVYAVTALSKPTVLRVGDPQCLDDWCLAVDRVERVPTSQVTRYDVALRIFSRARRVAQRESVAKDVFLVDERWNRYDPTPAASEPPLNTLLQPGASVAAHRSFNLPRGAQGVRLELDHSNDGFPVCLVIGECGAFHKAIAIRLE